MMAKHDKLNVFIGCVAYGDVDPTVLQSMFLWATHNGANYRDDYRIYFSVASKKEQYRARNALVKQAREVNADVLLMVDDDQTPHHTLDCLKRFEMLKQPIAGGLYYQRGGAYHPVVMKEFKGLNNTRKYRFYHVSELPKKPGPVDVLGGGFNWIEMSVFDKIREYYWWPTPRYVSFVPDSMLGLDVHFCQKAREAGYECWLDPNIHVGHVSYDRLEVSRNSRPSQEWIEQQPAYRIYQETVYGLADWNPDDIPDGENGMLTESDVDDAELVEVK